MKVTKLIKKIAAATLVLSMVGGIAACNGATATTTTTKAAETTATTTAVTTAVTTAATTAAATTASAWKPTQGVTIVVPYGAGGSTDLLARAVEKIWSKYCDQPVTIEIKSGGGGVTGNLFVANSKPDGYTLAIGFGSGSETVMPYVQPVEYKPFEQLKPICRLSVFPVAIAVNADSKFKTIQEFIDYAKTTSTTAASSTAAGSVDFVMRGLAKITGIDLTPIPNDGTATAMTALLGNQNDIGGGHPADMAAHLESGKIRVLAVATEERDATLPDAPTLKESGIDLVTWGSIKGIAGPAGIPDEVVAYYEQLFAQICADEDFIATCKSMYISVMYLNSSDFMANLTVASESYAKLSDELGIKEAIAAEQGT